MPPGGRPLADADEAVPVGLTTPSGQRLQCGVPVQRPPGGEAVAAAARRARAASRGALFDGIETLLSAYDGLCFLRVRLLVRVGGEGGSGDNRYVHVDAEGALLAMASTLAVGCPLSVCAVARSTERLPWTCGHPTAQCFLCMYICAWP